MSAGGRICPICGQPLRPAGTTARLSIARCARCGHSVAEHRSDERSDVDYHRQYDEGEFLASLTTTRRRQAKTILDSILAQVPGADALLDFGAGRGWFLEEARALGMARLAGTDTSSDSVDGLRQRGIHGVLIPPPTETGWDLRLGTLPFRPRVLTFLDVIEHFPAERLSLMFKTVVDQLRPDLELVVIKVPVSDGLLYRTADALSRARVFGPREQLYQVGTFPPHYSYFSRRSLAEFLARHGLTRVDAFGLLEFDPTTFGSRVAALRRAPHAATRLLGATTALVAERTTQDSYVALARPVAGSGS